jgi:hypothetical protein
MCTGCGVTNHKSDCCASRGNGDRSDMKTMGLHHLQRQSDCSEVREEEAQWRAATVSADTNVIAGLPIATMLITGICFCLFYWGVRLGL